MENYGTNVVKSVLSVKQKVRKVLEKYPSARGDYRLLYYYYIREYCPHLTITFREFADLFNQPSPETISRCARKIFEEEPSLLPTMKTQKKRYIRQLVLSELMLNEVV